MKAKITAIIISATIVSCSTATQKENIPEKDIPIQGTWKLITGITIEKNDSTVTDYTAGKSFIKVINDSHFAFMGHDLTKGKDSAAFYSSGGGKYELNDSTYTEHLEYCNDRQWEGNDFHFTVTINNDTLVQQGIEKIDSIGVNRINIEKYVRVK
ncbi:lipocalin-like domain-containing protein [Panacibacter ginsenosidivorans]|uniref:Lipocalin-like domain-containing protein n=1 Tax=Panacibacter ginsenosidivorans TaxID=1813871 RepID=A0A5B8VIB6_9BACT|nr:lipocalin-like domain-containing protein [Panacibacter ginsenosidivorans]QEC70028.1 lipocalin-like domain-containing protein [Panacibacter ginsenosidivorans]